MRIALRQNGCQEMNQYRAAVLTLFNSSQVAIAGNDNWGGNNALATTGGRVGAFALFSPTSRDAVLLMTLAPGSYTAQVSPVSGTAGGTAIVEVYEVP